MEVVLPPTDCVLDQITCLHCRKIPNDPASTIYLCTNNHLFCNTCYTTGTVRGKKCRMTGCVEQLKKTQDPILQDIYLNSFFHCGYPRCPEIILGGELKTHKDECHYRQIECPSCKIMIRFDAYMEHLANKHNVHSQNYFTEHDFLQEVPVRFPHLDSKTDRGASVTHFHKFQNENFFTHVIISSRDISLWVQYYGDIWKERDYAATICLQNSFGHKLEATIPIVPIHWTFLETQRALMYAHFSREMLRCYLHDDIRNNKTQANNRRLDGLESSTGTIMFRILFSFNFIEVFKRNLYFDQQRFGIQSEC